MKRKLIIAGVVVVGLFVGVILVVGLLGSSRKAAENYNQVTVTPDGKLVVHPSERQKAMFVVNSSAVTNVPAATNAAPR
jgi:hypothetical protein